MGYENNDKKVESVFSKRIKAGKRRTYFFDVRATKGKDFFLTITESRKRFNDESFERHKIFLYKEDFNKFVKGLAEVVDYVKTELMPDYNFDAFNHEYPDGEYEPENNYASGNGHAVDQVLEEAETVAAELNVPPPSTNGSTEEVDKW